MKRDGIEFVCTMEPGESLAMVGDTLIIAHPDRPPVRLVRDGAGQPWRRVTIALHPAWHPSHREIL
jgi:hypothetical protein